jgi:hypothetical protein
MKETSQTLNLARENYYLYRINGLNQIHNLLLAFMVFRPDVNAIIYQPHI